MKSNIVYLVNIRDECLSFCLVLVKYLKMKHIILLIVCFASVLVLSAAGGENEHSENNLSLNLLKNEINELRRQMKEVDSRVGHLENENDDTVIFSAYKNQNDGTR